MSLEIEAKENILTLPAGNALLEIIPEVGGSITRYCLVSEEQTFNFLRPASHTGLCDWHLPLALLFSVVSII